MDGVASLLMHRVDAARKLMSVPGKGAEATGCLFLAKRCHEAAKAGKDVLGELDGIAAEVKAGLGEASHAGVEAEARLIRQELSPPPATP